MKICLKKTIGMMILAMLMFVSAIGFVVSGVLAEESQTVDFTVKKVEYVNEDSFYVYGAKADGSNVTFAAQYMSVQDQMTVSALAPFFSNILVNGKNLLELDAEGITYGSNFFTKTASPSLESDCVAFTKYDKNNGWAKIPIGDGTKIVFQEGLRLVKQEGDSWSLSEYKLSKTQTFLLNTSAQTWTEEVEEEPSVEYVDVEVGNVIIGMKNSLEVPFVTTDGEDITYPVEGVNAQDHKNDEKFTLFFDNVLFNGKPISQAQDDVTYVVHLFKPSGRPDHIAIFAFEDAGGTIPKEFKTGDSVTLQAGLVLLSYKGEQPTGGVWGLSDYKLKTSKTFTYDEATLEWTDVKEIKGITLDKETANLETGKTLQLQAMVSGGIEADKTVVWTSSNETIATVAAEGTVSAVTAGSVTITATTVNGKKAVCEITVTSATEITSVMISQSRATIEAGKTLELKVTINGNSQADTKTAVWTSSDEKVATVDQNGKVTAVAEGKCVITVTSADSSKKATCTVTVTAAEVEESGGCGGSVVSAASLSVVGGVVLLAIGILVLRRKQR